MSALPVADRTGRPRLISGRSLPVFYVRMLTPDLVLLPATGFGTRELSRLLSHTVNRAPHIILGSALLLQVAAVRTARSILCWSRGHVPCIALDYR